MGEPRPLAKLGRQIRVYLTTPAELMRQAAMWSAVCEFAGGSIPSVVPEKRTSVSREFVIGEWANKPAITWRRIGLNPCRQQFSIDWAKPIASGTTFVYNPITELWDMHDSALKGEG